MRRPHHNFERKWQAALRWLGVKVEPKYSVHVLHDDGCAFLKGGYCDCNPDIRVQRSDTGTSR